MNKEQTLHKFWSSFGIKAYDENTVDNDATLPYITYEMRTDSFGHALSLSASLWYRDSSWLAITAKEHEIYERIGRGGEIIDYDDGALWIHRGSPWATRMDEPTDDTIRRIILNLSVEYLD